MKRCVVYISMFFLIGCGIKIGSANLDIKQDLIVNKYDTLKEIVIEEAKNNGFTQLTSEIKPSKYNDQKGRLFFQLVTPHGTDQLFVDFDNGNIYMHGAGLRSNPESAIKAITFRINELNDAYGAKNTPAAVPEKISVDTTSNNSQQETKKLEPSEIKPDVKPDVKVTSSDPVPPSTSMIVNEGKAKLRKNPSAKAAAIKTLKKGEEVQVIKEKDGWCLVELAGGETGWCLKGSLAQKN
jgi:hypothetical protein